MEDPENFNLDIFPKIRTALGKAVEKRISAVVCLMQAIGHIIEELISLREMLDCIERKKKKSTFTWWIRKHYHFRKARKYLRQKVDTDKIKLNAVNDPRLLDNFTDAIAAYDEVIQLCQKQMKKRRTFSRLLQKAYRGAVTILQFARAAVFAMQVYEMVSSQSTNMDLADAVLKDLIEACKEKRRILILTAQATKKLMEKTVTESQESKADVEVIQRRMENTATNVNKLCELIKRHKLSVLLRERQDNICHQDLEDIRQSCRALMIGSSRSFRS